MGNMNTTSPAIEELITRWEKRIELNEAKSCSLAERARRKLANAAYRLVIDELCATLAKESK